MHKSLPSSERKVNCVARRMSCRVRSIREKTPRMRGYTSSVAYANSPYGEQVTCFASCGAGWQCLSLTSLRPRFAEGNTHHREPLKIARC